MSAITGLQVWPEAPRAEPSIQFRFGVGGVTGADMRAKIAVMTKPVAVVDQISISDKSLGRDLRALCEFCDFIVFGISDPYR